MRFKIFLDDLSADMVSRIKWVLRYDLTDEINEAVAQGADRNDAEEEVIGDYLNRHNVGFEVEI